MIEEVILCINDKGSVYWPDCPIWIIRLDSVRSSHLPIKMHQVGYVRSSLLILMHVGSIATPNDKSYYIF